MDMEFKLNVLSYEYTTLTPPEAGNSKTFSDTSNTPPPFLHPAASDASVSISTAYFITFAISDVFALHLLPEEDWEKECNQGCDEPEDEDRAEIVGGCSKYLGLCETLRNLWRNGETLNPLVMSWRPAAT